MLVLLGGLLGSGRRPLAFELALRKGFFHYKIGTKKLRSVSRGLGRGANILQPRTDDERMEVYRKAAKELPWLAKLYPDVVIDEGFHRALPREYFLKEARKYFDPVKFIWVESDEDVAQERLRTYYKPLGQLREMVRQRAWQHELLQQPPDSVPRFKCGADIQQELISLWECIQNAPSL